MMNIATILLLLAVCVTTISAFADSGDAGYPIPAPPSMFCEAQALASDDGEVLLSVYFGSLSDEVPLIAYLITPFFAVDNAPAFFFDISKEVEPGYQVRVTSLTVMAGDTALSVDFQHTDLFEGGLLTADVVKDGGKVLFTAPKMTLPDTLTLVLNIEAEFIEDSVYRIFGESSVSAEFDSAVFK